jgi:antitoxin (DNA-binding transcriptional repressor) of toxin-antitoxin stability system
MDIGSTKRRVFKFLTHFAPDQVLAKAGHLIGKLIPFKTTKSHRKLDTAKGDFVVPDDFNEPLPKGIEESFWK